LLVEFQDLRGDTVHMLLVEPLGMPTSHPQQTSDGFLRDLHETGRGPDATALIQMADDILRRGLWKLGVE